MTPRRRLSACTRTLLSVWLTIEPLARFPAHALTEGPSAPEVQTFAPATVENLVDPFTGDFIYNVNLLDVGGYPVNLTYRSGAGTETEASWVGLGWTLSPGVVNRTVRGVPDDFRGERIETTTHLQTEETWGISTGPGFEYFGFGSDNVAAGAGVAMNVGFTYNNYRGWDREIGFTPGLRVGDRHGDEKLSGSLSLSYGMSTSGGAYVAPNLGLGYSVASRDREDRLGIGIGTRVSSSQGLSHVSFGGSFSRAWGNTARGINGQTMFRPNGMRGGMSHQFPLAFVSPAYPPVSAPARSSVSASFDAKLGGEVVGLSVSGHVQGYFAIQQLARPTERTPAFGYLYAHDAGRAAVMHDVTREGDGPYVAEDPILPRTFHAHDLYTVSAHGLTGTFRPFRGEIGTLGESGRSTSSNGVDGGFEVGLGNLTHVGADILVNHTVERTGTWLDGNAFAQLATFTGSQDDRPGYEPVFFENVSELTELGDPDHFASVGGFEAVAVPVNRDGTADGVLRSESATRPFGPRTHMRRTREPRQHLFSWLTAREASAAGFERYLRSSRRSMTSEIDDFTGDRYFTYAVDHLERVTDERAAHHVSEVTVTKGDGARYHYGIPVYNTRERRVSFNVSGRAVDARRNLVAYNSSDRSSANRNGTDHYYRAVATPPYAYAYLLTAITSQDYVDLTGNGPSPDDLGTYTKFNYTRDVERYRWRVPVESYRAHFNPGWNSRDGDETGSYTYGEKEVWYLHSIETRTMIAEFSVSDRDDLLPALGEDGGVDPSGARMKKLDRVTLFTRADRLANGPDATPIQTVHLSYDYSLCRGAPNAAGGGKLTLREVSFSNAESQKQRRSPYRFHYEGANPDYDTLAVDRWGTYQPNDAGLPNHEHPYTSQRREDADRRAAAWQLSRIEIPSGGAIEVSYEADDYAYVQDRFAVVMRPIVGFSHAPSAGPTGELYSATHGDHNYVFFTLAEPAESPADVALYLSGLGELYFRARVDVWGSEASVGTDRYEAISGFVPLGEALRPNVDYGLRDATTAWLKLAEPDADNPIALAAWQTLRKSLPDVLHPPYTPSGEDFFAFLGTVALQIPLIVEMVEDFSGKMRGERRGQRIHAEKSFIRLVAPGRTKLGGGSRVRRVTIADGWERMTGDPALAFTYGQELDYTIEERIDGRVRPISSGVASYEPLVGGDENALVTPVRYRRERLLAADLLYAKLAPFGETVFPAPSVGYRRITIRNLSHPGVERSATGSSVFEFYTARDFPIITRHTPKQHEATEAPPITPFYSEKTATASQGFYVELNDMHGKLRAHKLYAEGDTEPVSVLEHRYRTDPADDHRLDSRAAVISPETGRAEQRIVGVNYDLFVDARESMKETFSPGAQINTDGFLASIIPIYIPTILPELSYAFSRYRGLVTTKVVTRAGILEEIRSFDEGATVATRFEAFDGRTGEALVTATESEHGEPYFETTIPAHWVHSGMAGGYLNVDVRLDSISIVGGTFDHPQAELAFHRADELLLERLDETEAVPVTDPGIPPLARLIPPERAWVYSVDGERIALIDSRGLPYANGQYRLRVVRSGRRNLPATSLGEVVTLASPIGTDGLRFDRVTGASAQTYDEHWQTYAAFHRPERESSCECALARDTTGTPVTDLVHRLLVSVPLVEPDGRLLTDRATNDYLKPDLGVGDLYWYGEVNGSRLDGVVRNAATGRECALRLRTADGSAFPRFPGFVSGATGFCSPLDFDDYGCRDRTGFRMTAIHQDAEGVHEVEIHGESECFSVLDCAERVVETPSVCGLTPGATVNPFVLDVLGTWRPKATHEYVTTRVYGEPLSRSGTFSDFATFWNLHETFAIAPARDVARWQRSELATVTDPFGNVLEGRDPLGTPSATERAFALTHPSARAINARKQDVAVDGFEDYDVPMGPATAVGDCARVPHWRIDGHSVPRSNVVSHSGRFSLVVADSVTVRRRFTAACDPADRAPPGGDRYELQDCDLIRSFAPTGGEYVLSAWVLESPTSASEPITRYTNASIDVTVTAGTGARTHGFHPEGVIIDGWQRIEGRFPVAESELRSIAVTFRNDGDRPIYVDDVRIQPLDARVEAYVYDPRTMRLSAILDERNHATFHEYDLEGHLARLKRETESGVLTIQEVRAASPKREVGTR